MVDIGTIRFRPKRRESPSSYRSSFQVVSVTLSRWLILAATSIPVQSFQPGHFVAPFLSTRKPHLSSNRVLPVVSVLQKSRIDLSAAKEPPRPQARERTSTSTGSARARKKAKENNQDIFLFRSMIGHDMLTKKEELRLGTAVQRANRLRTTVEQLALEKFLSQENERDEALEMLPEEREQLQNEDLFFNLFEEQQQNNRNEGEEEGENMHLLSTYGLNVENGVTESPQQQEQDALQLISRQEDRLRLQEDSSFLEIVRRQHVSDEKFDNEYDDDSQVPIDNFHLLTDQELLQQVNHTRAQVKAIVLEGAQARETLIRSNMKLVVGICKKWARNSASQDSHSSLHQIYSGGWDRPSVNEAIQEGVMGLTKAADRYKPERGFRFSTYATYWITNSVRQCFKRATTGVLRVPSNYYETKTKFRTLVKHYYDTDGAVPPLEDLASEMGIAVPRLQKILRLTQPMLSTDAPRNPGGNMRAGKAGNDGDDSNALLICDTLVDSYEAEPEDRVELSFLRQSLENAMATELAPHERDIIRLRLGLDDGVARTCRQVAQEYGGSLTASEVRAAEKRALKKLRSPHALATYKFLAYLDFAGVDRQSISFR